MSRAADRFPAGTVLAGKLKVVQVLGVGGMGAVYEVEHTLTHHRRALKLLHAEMRGIPGVVDRFLREASAAGRIGNQHIVETFDAGYLESGEPYIVMELLQGRTLAALLDEQGFLPLEQTCEVLTQVCDGISAAHAAGIVHRDLKPENIFLTGARGDFVKLLDFGVSKFDAAATGVQGLTLEGSPIGTPYYMSPEQVRGEKSVDARADIYALGVLFYECTTGQKPFQAETLPHLAVLIHEGKFTPATAVRAGLPQIVDNIAQRAMASDPAARFTTVQELAEQFATLRASVSALDAARPRPAQTHPGVQRIGTLTPAPFSTGSEPARKSRHTALVLAAAVVVAACVAAVLWIRRPAQVQRPTAEAVPPTAEPVPAARLDVSARAATAGVPSSLPAPSSSPAPLTAASAVPAPPAAGAATPRERPAGAPASSRETSRARSHGLSEENPFQ